MYGGSDPVRRGGLPGAFAAGARRAEDLVGGTGTDPRRMEVFLEAMTPPGPAHLAALEREALEAGVPIIRPQAQALLRFFLCMHRPLHILEIGTAVGFSALLMRHYAPPECRILTIEKDPARAAKARENIARCAGGIEVLEGDALEILPALGEDGSFDFVFMDAAKGQYIHYLPEVLRLLRGGGILLADNILQEGEVLASRYAVTRRSRTIHSRMRAFVRALMEDPALETLLVPAGDGCAVSWKHE